MAGNIKLKSDAVSHLQANTSAALASAAAAQLATADYDNSAGLDFWASARLTTNGFGATPTTGTTVDLYLVPFLDGANPSTVDASTPKLPANAYVGSFTLITTGSIQYLDIEGIPLGPFKYRGYVVNNIGQQMSAGWMVDVYPFEEQYT